MTRRRHYSPLPSDAVYISVYCAERSHASEPFRIATFYMRPDVEDWPTWPDGSFRWLEAWGDYWTADGEVLPFGLKPVGTSLVGDRPEADRDALNVPDSRTRYRLECRTCGLAGTWRAEKLNPALSRLWLAGVSEVALRSLLAILRGA